MKNRPWGITLACLVLALSCITLLYGGISEMSGAEVQVFDADGLDVAEEGAEEVETPVGNYFILNSVGAITAVPFGMILLGAILGVFAYLIWQQNEIGWYASVALLVVGIVVDLVIVAMNGVQLGTAGIVAMGVSLLILIGLLHRKTIEAISPSMVNFKGWDLKGVV